MRWSIQSYTCQLICLKLVKKFKHNLLFTVTRFEFLIQNSQIMSFTRDEIKITESHFRFCEILALNEKKKKRKKWTTSNCRCCHQETPSTTGWNLDIFYPHYTGISKVVFLSATVPLWWRRKSEHLVLLVKNKRSGLLRFRRPILALHARGLFFMDCA